MSDTFEPNELYRLENVVLDIARNVGSETAQNKLKIGRLVNRAATLVMGHDRKWSWQKVTTHFNTVATVEKYSLDKEAREILQFWKSGTNRGRLDRIPSAQFRKYVPDTTFYSGVPRMWDEEGVDTNGSKIVSLFPIPDAAYPIYYQYFRHLLPIRNDQTNIWSYWGMPPNVIEGCLIPMATALYFKGIDDDRYQEERQDAMNEIEAAYAADQQKANTIIRVPANDVDTSFADGPLLPPNFSTY